ncbi:hypothetical protein VOLCADRAFT_91767 [Volvox carteri f. nagariensis]|uniref:Uncharacterized protein n=1 Tax=Volvox carteri f. nagariensis TaxID=3068 RepID=D8TXX0_VOLCA|nr:uncharacterized protein VOLCADRAFT_91767 [Volvox carteri f. nagariensis]EFJ47719.1 hypothetical protein VOLCADRAFT_91767 [Volvox carteri f. nagariensis]|eukprot:XP_002951190.1 hypothetical protein VOLCADRAFT_91767 [Volvox carteri f. nagariensis]
MTLESLLARRTQSLVHPFHHPTRCPSARPRVLLGRRTSVRATTPGSEATILIPTNSKSCSRDYTQPPCWIPPLIVFGVATLFSAVILKNRQRKSAVTETDQVLPVPPSPQQDPRSYQRALARTRQAAAVSKALAFLKTGEPARAYMELGRALSENSICRSPLLDGHHTKAELVELYKLHLQNAEVPPNFATLLQLQEMLGLNQDEAEKIELEVMQAPGSFSI